MQKIDKSADKILSTKYKDWYDSQVATNNFVGKSSRQYYDDIVMNLFACQRGVCAYTEMKICLPELYNSENWENGKYKMPENAAFQRIDHLGELEHFDSANKKVQYWNWDNLFMIEAKINGLKSDQAIVPYLKPDLPDYSPEIYFDYDSETNRFVPNTDLENDPRYSEIKNMIDNVLFLNHGLVKSERENYINELKSKKARGEKPSIDRFYTAVKIVLGD